MSVITSKTPIVEIYLCHTQTRAYSQITLSIVIMSSEKSASVSMTNLEKVPKLEDHEGYLQWRRTMRDRLKMLELWTYLEDQADRPTGVSEAKVAAWKAGHDKTCTALRLVVDGNAYSDIEDMTNASEAWKLLETNFKPRGSGFLNDSFQKLLNLTLANCKSSADYVSQFCNIVTELKNFSTKFKLDENFLIFLFQSNLGSEHASYFEMYAQEHDLFTENGDAKYTLSSTMHHFQNTVRNPKSKPSIDKTAVALVAANTPTHQNIIQDGVQAGTDNSRVLTVQKTVKYCVFCKRDYHTESEGHLKNPSLAPPKSNKSGRKQRQRPNENDNTDKKGKAENGSSYLAHEGPLITFMATQSLSTSMFDNAWVWDCGCSQHVTPDRSVFVSFQKLSGQKPVKDLAGSLIPIGIGNVRLSCISTHGPRIVKFRNVLYIPEATVSLISQGQIHQQGHHLKITSDGIALGNSRIVAKLSSNNLYLVHLTKPASTSKTDLALTAINEESVKMWYE